MTRTHTLGFPRIGAARELKFATERYWRGEIDRDRLREVGAELRARHWQQQAEAGLDLVPVGDFSFYDGVLDLSVMLGNVPSRFGPVTEAVDPDIAFGVARGRSADGSPVDAGAMTKWFDTNYHYIVPEFHDGQAFRVASDKLFGEVDEALAQGIAPKPVLVGPLTYLWLGKHQEEGDRLALLDSLLAAYGEILKRLRETGVEWVQLDEPILALDLPVEWKRAFERAYSQLGNNRPKLLLAVYFGGLGDNLQLACGLPVDGLHVDAVRAPDDPERVADNLGPYKVLSAGIVDGRNVWRTDLDAALARLEPLHQRLGERLWLAPSCSLLHVPVDLALETDLDGELKDWLAFAVQKLGELDVLARALEEGRDAVAADLAASRNSVSARRTSARTRAPAVRERTAAITPAMLERAEPYPERARRQGARLDLPLLPTTTIGSFPQTGEIRKTRRDYRRGEMSRSAYVSAMEEEIADVIERQERLGLDVLVHGEAERNDMVEYFGEQLEGYAFTRHGWVQSYGSRCVKPPIIFGDVSRPRPMTVEWSRFAQSLTERPVKGMLTGPVTMMQWAFVRDDQPRSATCRQIALALRDEVADLQAAGIRAIQVDEPALREGLPLRRGEWSSYLRWAVDAFRLAVGSAEPETQIHTHMCYSEFNDIIASIAQLDADVITIEASRSDMELLEAFEDFEYPNEIGPGVYDIHSPNIPGVEEMIRRLELAAEKIPVERLWVNPDCGLKTRGWSEVEAALANMVEAARRAREILGSGR